MNINECISIKESIRKYYEWLSFLNFQQFRQQLPAIVDDLMNTIPAISEETYGIVTDKAETVISLLSKEDLRSTELIEEFGSWLGELEIDINLLSERFCMLDIDFESMMLSVERSSEEKLLNRLYTVLNSFKDASPDDYRRISYIYTKYAHFWGGFDPKIGNYNHFINAVHAVKENTNKIRWLYNVLADYRSKKVLYGVIRFWLLLDFEYKESIIENNYNDYFDLDVFNGKISKDEVIVDCGAFTGDTAKLYFENYKCCKKMYLYDMVPANLKKASEVLEGQDSEIVFVNAGVGSKEQAGTFISVYNEESPAFAVDNKKGIAPDNSNCNGEKIDVKLISLDEDIKEQISFLKMDIEGSELDALRGAKNHIMNDHPKLAICTYHHYEDLWKIPEMILSIYANYRLYLRYNGENYGVMASEHVLLAV